MRSRAWLRAFRGSYKVQAKSTDPVMLMRKSPASASLPSWVTGKSNDDQYSMAGSLSK